ncbi:Major facilitator superfamily domain-containing protein 6-A [Taenia crassiceps]|uniref:Major facilitator superfamily domain-containing protein 6-A n=1 Tax=Taenia crassiceps TaxID=6207 RepID=A0ABR4QRE6_9CEST
MVLRPHYSTILAPLPFPTDISGTSKLIALCCTCFIRSREFNTALIEASFFSSSSSSFHQKNKEMDAANIPPLAEEMPAEVPSGGIRAVKRELLEWFHSPINRSLLIFKLFYFLFYAAFGSLFPLLSIYFKQLGLNATQCGALGGARSLVEWVGAPFWSGIADRWKKGKLFLMISLLSWIIFTLGLGFVRPQPEGCLVSVTGIHPKNSSVHPFDIRIMEPFREVTSERIEAIEMKPYLAVYGNTRIGQSPLELNMKKLLHKESSRGSLESMSIDRSGTHARVTDEEAFADVSHYSEGSLVMPLFSTVVYRKSKINQIFIIAMILICVGAFFSSPAICLADSAVMTFLEENGPHPYGRQRMFGSVGWGLAMFFVGIALDQSQSFPDHPCLRPGRREKNYMVSFAVFTVFMSCAAIAGSQLRFAYDGAVESMYFKVVKDKVAKTLRRGRMEKNRGKLVNQDDEAGEEWRGDGGYSQSGNEGIAGDNSASNEDILEQQLGIKLNRSKAEQSDTLTGLPASDPFVEDLAATAQTKITQYLTVLKQFTRPRLAFFLFVTWFMGIGSGIVFSFLFWHLQELGGSPTLYGIASIINYLSEIITYYFSKPAIERFGHTKILYLGLLINVLRFLYVSWIGNPWWVLPFEFVHGITNAGVWAASCSYIAQSFASQYRFSTQGVLQGVNHGFGKGLGAVFGGVVTTYFGTGNLFRAYGATSAIILIGFLLINYLVKEKAAATLEEKKSTEAERRPTLGHLLFPPRELRLRWLRLEVTPTMHLAKRVEMMEWRTFTHQNEENRPYNRNHVLIICLSSTTKANVINFALSKLSCSVGRARMVLETVLVIYLATIPTFVIIIY